MTRHPWARAALVLLTMVWAGACSDSAGPDGPGVPGSPGTPGTAVVGAAGGEVTAALAGGGTLVLSIPAGALSDSVAITISPVEPVAGEYAAFTFSPAGLEFFGPVTFSATLGSDVTIDGRATLTFDLGPVAVPSPSLVDISGRRVTTILRHLGWASGAGPVSARGPSPSSSFAGGGSGAVVSQDYLDLLAALLVIADSLKTTGSFQNAEAFLSVLQSLVVAYGSVATADANIPPAMSEMRRVVCGQYSFALSDLETYADAGGVPGLSERIRQVLRWGETAIGFTTAAHELQQAGCPEPLTDPAQAIGDKLTAFLPLIEEEISLFNVADSAGFRGIIRDRLLQLLKLTANFRFNQQLEPFDVTVTTFVSGQFVRLRNIAYATCSATGAQQMHRLLVATEIAYIDAEAASPYSLADIQSDAQLCGLGVRWRLLDAGGTARRADSLGGGTLPGPRVLDTLTLGAQQVLELTGPARALACSADGGDGGDLQVRVLSGGHAPATVATRPAGPGTYLPQPILIQGAELRSIAEVSPGEIVYVIVELQRTGDFCGSEFNLTGHSEPLRFEVRLAETVRITTTTLPDGMVGEPYSQALTAEGSTGSYNWSVVSGALPSGLSLAATTGVISGTPSFAGPSTFTVQVRSGTDSAQQVLSVQVLPNGQSLEILTTVLPDGRVGVPYGVQLMATLAPETLTWTVSGGLPNGLQVTPSGLISGTPIGTDTVSLNISVTDGALTDATTLELRILGDTLRVVTTSITVSLPDKRFTPFIPMTAALQASGGRGPPYVWTLLSGVLPVGSTMSPDGVISGNVTDGGSAVLQVRVSDGVTTVDASIQVVYVCCFF